MFKAVTIGIGIILGCVIGYIFFNQQEIIESTTQNQEEIIPQNNTREVVGFLPYWLLDKADKDYTQYITTLAYFALTIDGDGTIQKYTNPGEAEPGWYALNGKKVANRLSSARRDGLKLSLVLFSANEESIAELISKPKEHAQTLMDEVAPIMEEHQFTDLNIDVESVQLATPESRARFTEFMAEIRRIMNEEELGSLSIDASPSVFIKKYLVDPEAVAPLVDRFIIMGYDYHYQGSSVTGPVAPLAGVESISEFDTVTGVKLAVKTVPAEKLILAIPLYGYEWETIDPFNRAATIPGSGITASNRRVEEQLVTCKNCILNREKEGDEPYVVYKNRDTGVYHQIFYPDMESTKSKVKLAEQYELGGMGLWALGYEGDTILEPLKEYK